MEIHRTQHVGDDCHNRELDITSHYLEIDRISKLFAKIVNLQHLALSICHRKHKTYLLEGACEKLSS